MVSLEVQDTIKAVYFKESGKTIYVGAPGAWCHEPSTWSPSLILVRPNNTFWCFLLTARMRSR